FLLNTSSTFSSIRTPWSLLNLQAIGCEDPTLPDTATIPASCVERDMVVQSESSASSKEEEARS
ncbi:unnamed protein product, partial [Linum tenue]